MGRQIRCSPVTTAYSMESAIQSVGWLNRNTDDTVTRIVLNRIPPLTSCNFLCVCRPCVLHVYPVWCDALKLLPSTCPGHVAPQAPINCVATYCSIQWQVTNDVTRHLSRLSGVAQVASFDSDCHNIGYYNRDASERAATAFESRVLDSNPNRGRKVSLATISCPRILHPTEFPRRRLTFYLHAFYAYSQHDTKAKICLILSYRIISDMASSQAAGVGYFNNCTLRSVFYVVYWWILQALSRLYRLRYEHQMSGTTKVLHRDFDISRVFSGRTAAVCDHNALLLDKWLAVKGLSRHRPKHHFCLPYIHLFISFPPSSWTLLLFSTQNNSFNAFIVALS